MKLLTNPRGAHAATLIICAFFLTILVGCSGGNDGNQVGGTAAAMIGPAGGQISSSDGMLTLTFPPGALTTMQEITITEIAVAALDPAIQARFPDRAWRVDPAGLVFAQPVDLEVDLGGLETAEASGGEVGFLLGRIFLKEEPEYALPNTRTVVDHDLQLRSLLAELDESGELILKENAYATVTVDPPDVIPAGGSGPVFAQVLPISSQTVITNTTWSAITSVLVDDLSDTPVPFTSLFNIYCGGAGSSGQVTMNIQFDATVPGPGSLDPPYDDHVVLDFKFPVSCLGGGGSGFSVVDGVVNLAAFIDQVEAVQVVDRINSFLAPVGFAPTNALPFLIVAGSIPGSTGRCAVSVDPSGTVQPNQYLGGGNGSAFDAHAIVSRDAQREAFFVSGNDAFLIEAVSPWQFSSGGLLSMGFHEDTTEIADDEANGVVSAVGFAAKVSSIDSGGVRFDSYGFLTPIRSVVMNATQTRALVIRGSTDLAYVVLDPMTNSVVSETSVRPLGSDPRRIRWDPVSGLAAISDFADDTITALIWDGQSMPTMIGTTAVGSGPVGIDVHGDLIFAVGFNDDTWTRIEVDVAGLGFQQVMTAAIPYAPVNGTSFQPGHIKALGDADNSVVISNFGDNSITLMTNAFN